MGNNELLLNKVCKNIGMLKKHSKIKKLFNELEATENCGIGIFGGAVRDWWLGKTPKDIDIVISTPDFEGLCERSSVIKPIDYNKFGGTVVKLDGITFDLWELSNTYSFKRGHFSSSWKNLVKSVPFNTDSVCVLTNGDVYEYKFWEALKTKEIDFVNKKVKDEKVIAERAKAFAKKYKFTLSAKLQKFVNDNEDNFDSIFSYKTYSSSNF